MCFRILNQDTMCRFSLKIIHSYKLFVTLTTNHVLLKIIQQLGEIHVFQGGFMDQSRMRHPFIFLKMAVGNLSFVVKS